MLRPRLMTFIAMSLLCVNSSMLVAQGELDAKKVRATCDKIANNYQIEAADGRALRLYDQSLLQWSKNTYEDVYGNVYLWTDDGIPAAVASIYQFVRPKDDIDAEFHSLSTGKIVAKAAGREVWKPSLGGITFTKLKSPITAASTAPQRRTQMRTIARQFRAERRTPGDGTTQLRLLSTPVYRYSNPKRNVIDGAIYAFVDQTDPEVWLIIEARKASDGATYWQYATARMNTFELQVYQGNDNVFQAPTLESYDQPSKPYAIFRRLQDLPSFISR